MNVLKLCASLMLLSNFALSQGIGSGEFVPSPAQPMGWRGDGMGRFPGATPPTEWSATKNVKWSAKVGRGYASPIFTEKLAIIVSEPNRVLALDRGNGEVRWTVEIKPEELADEKERGIARDYTPPKDGSGMAAATPLTDGQRIYIVLANGMVRALDMEGKTVWTAFIAAEQSTGYGRSSSPILVGQKLIVHMTNLYAFDPASGKQLWMNDQAKSSYGTPCGLKIGAVDYIATPVGDIVRAEDGKGVASDIGRAGHSSPIDLGAGTVLFGDNMVSAVRLNEKFKDDEVWNSSTSGEVFGSPMLHESTIFIATGEGELFTFDAKSKGAVEAIAHRKLFEDAGGGGPAAYSSLTLAGKYFYFHSNKGETMVLEATREAKLVVKNKLPGGTGSSPVFAGKSMFIRDGDKLFCIGG